MKYGFIIDNRKCIGCHACTTACKSEHEVPLGVFRTYVKQVEKGVFPDTRRLFSVMRCNHCTDAPCVEICPVEALFFRDDGIVDFDKDRCIGCKSCMQACPYDALYIDPDTHTAAKCNYCAHRVDVGLEPACVVVCPEHAIISGDMDDPDTEISQLLSREPTTVRKPEKGTVPNLYYIEGDSYSLMPTAAAPQEDSLWSSQSRGVGHFAKYTERLAWQGEDLVKELLQKSGNVTDIAPGEPFTPQRSIEVLTGKSAKNVYNTPDKGILWGWEVAAYVTTKAIATGTYMILLGNIGVWEANGAWWGLGITLAFLMITTGLLIKDLDQPGRFIYVLLRPQWRSWLVRGGYGLVLFSGLVVFQLFATAYKYWLISAILSFPGILLAAFVSIYTAFLFAQARGRDFWQSPLLPLHMLIHSLMAGSATFILLISSTLLKLDPFVQATVMEKLNLVLSATILINLLIMLIELTITHSTSDTKATIAMILKGRYRVRFWWVVVAGCNIVPLISLLFNRSSAFIEIICSTAVIAGIYLTERIWLEAPQRIPLA